MIVVPCSSSIPTPYNCVSFSIALYYAPVSQPPNDQSAYMTYQRDTENYGKSTTDYHVLYDLKLLLTASFLSCSSLCVMFGHPEKSGILCAWIHDWWQVTGLYDDHGLLEPPADCRSQAQIKIIHSRQMLLPEHSGSKRKQQ